MKKTKIVATIGPASDTPALIEELIKLGVDVFRFNMKHNEVAWHEARIPLVKKIAGQLGKTVGVMIDLQGPELRIETKDKQPVTVAKGEVIKIGSKWDDSTNVVLPYPKALAQLKVDGLFLVDDGFLEFTVVESLKDGVSVRAEDDYLIKDHKGVNLPEVELDLSSLIDADLDKLNMAARSQVDFVALSFCRSSSDLKILRKEMAERGVVAKIVAKVESGQALTNIDEIIDQTDVVMVARGDLGVEVPIEQLAFWQKKIVDLCRHKHKNVIVATQMLESMTENPRPTRAEATDVGNAVWDGTDAVMLSGETASGKYPLKAVEAMASIVSFNETVAELAPLELASYDNTESIVAAAVEMERRRQNVAAFIVFTETGWTATVLASFRPKALIISITNNPVVAETLGLGYGIIPILYDLPEGEFKLPPELLKELVSVGLIKAGEEVILVHGQNWRERGATNSLALVKVTG